MTRFIPLKLYKYLARDFASWLIGSFLLLLALIYLLELSELLRRSQGIEEATYSVLIEMAFLKLPHITEELLPFVLFFSAILCLWRLNRYHELIVMRSAGISVWQFLMPIAMVSFLVGTADLCIVNPISSLMKQRYDHLESKYLRKKMYSLNLSESGIWIRQVEETNSTIFRIGKVDMDKAAFHDLTLYRYDKENHFVERIDAQVAWLIEDNLHLEKAWIQKAGDLPERQENLVIPSKLTLNKLNETNISPDSMSFWELSHFIYLLEKSGLLRDEYKLYWHALIARVFLACLDDFSRRCLCLAFCKTKENINIYLPRDSFWIWTLRSEGCHLCYGGSVHHSGDVGSLDTGHCDLYSWNFSIAVL